MGSAPAKSISLTIVLITVASAYACGQVVDRSDEAMYVVAPTAIAPVLLEGNEPFDDTLNFTDPFFYPEGETVTLIGNVPCPSPSSVQEAGCTVDIVGDEIRVDTTVLVEDERSDACSAGPIFTCESAPLAEGVYQVVFGTGSTTVEVPSMVDPSTSIFLPGQGQG